MYRVSLCVCVCVLAVKIMMELSCYHVLLLVAVLGLAYGEGKPRAVKSPRSYSRRRLKLF